MVSVAALAVGCGDDSSDTQQVREPAASTSVVLTTPTTPTRLTAAQGTYEDVKATLQAAGLQVCKERTSGADFSGSYEEHSLGVMAPTRPCPTDEFADTDALIVVDAYATDGELRRAVERFSGPDAYVGDGLVGFAWAPFIVSIREGSRPEAIEAFLRAASSLRGSTQVYDRR